MLSYASAAKGGGVDGCDMTTTIADGESGLENDMVLLAWNGTSLNAMGRDGAVGGRVAVPTGVGLKPVQLLVSYLTPRKGMQDKVFHLRVSLSATAAELRHIIADAAGIAEKDADVHVLIMGKQNRVNRIENMAKKHGGLGAATLKDLDMEDGKEVFVEKKKKQGAHDQAPLARAEVGKRQNIIQFTLVIDPGVCQPVVNNPAVSETTIDCPTDVSGAGDAIDGGAGSAGGAGGDGGDGGGGGNGGKKEDEAGEEKETEMEKEMEKAAAAERDPNTWKKVIMKVDKSATLQEVKVQILSQLGLLDSSGGGGGKDGDGGDSDNSDDSDDSDNSSNALLQPQAQFRFRKSFGGSVVAKKVRS